MDYGTYHADTNESNEDYGTFVDWLSERTATELRRVQGNPAEQKQALCWYYKRGCQAGLSTGALVDFLGVSSPSILDMAGYSDEEGDEVMAISAGLADDEIVGVLLENPV